jgi:outer membrane protein TolC
VPSFQAPLRPLLAVAVFLAAPALARGQASTSQALDEAAFVQVVLRTHPAARRSAALDVAAAAERKAGRAFPDPVVGFSWARARSLDGVRRDETAWSVTQTLPWPGTFGAGVRAADRQAEVFRAEGRATRWELDLEARSAFARLLFAREAVAIARAAEADAEELRDLTDRRAELGESREVDRIKAEVEWLKQRRTRASLEREAEAAEAILRGLAVERLPQPLVLAGELPGPLPPADLAALRARLAEENPVYRGARAASAREAARASVARRGRVPDLDVTVFHEEELDKTANGFEVGLRLPLWNANRGEIARAEAAATLAEAEAQRTRLHLEGVLERTAQELDVASAQVEILLGRLLPAAERSLELARYAYREGETSLLDLLDAQRTFRETQRETLASRFALSQALAEVRRLVGPGFEPGR